MSTELGGRARPGSEVRSLFEVLARDHGVSDPAAQQLKLSEADSILARGRGLGPGAVGIAVGHVQSGKTMSITTLAAHAADSGYRLVVMLLGTTHILLDQNTRRITTDLRIPSRDDYRWRHLAMPGKSVDLDFYLEQEDRVVLVTLLKTKARVGAFAAALQSSRLAASVPALIIDDEADQASLNAKVRKNDRSATYAAIADMRGALPDHVYVQYTATPFAPLLLEPDDRLSPDYVELLEPGRGYTGGRTFFIERVNDIVKQVDADEAADKEPDTMPASLDAALRSFVVGTAMQRCNEDLRPAASMLIHTSGLRAHHSVMERWVRQWLIAQRARAAADAADAGRVDWLRGFEAARADFVRTGVDDPPTRDFHDSVVWTLRHLRTWLVNSSEQAESVDWKASPVNLLIGGNKLDRGFTVRGLTTTYLTRSSRRGQADTIEQRARCYGYKSEYIDYCRIYAPDDVINDFIGLVHLEADMRDSLAEWTASGRDLKDWASAQGLLLPEGMAPTRQNVLLGGRSEGFTGWSYLRRPTFDVQDVASNDRLVAGLGPAARVRTWGDVRAEIHEPVPTPRVVDLLERWRAPASPGWDRELLVRGLRSLDAAGLVPAMHVVRLTRAGGPRERSWREHEGFRQLMQGENPGTGYPGDRGIMAGKPHLQIHVVRRRDSDDGCTTHGLALHLPGQVGAPVSRFLR